MYICQTLLNDPEQGCFFVAGESGQFGGDFYLHVDTAAFRKAFGIPAHCGREPKLVEEGRVKQIRYSFPDSRLDRFQGFLSNT